MVTEVLLVLRLYLILFFIWYQFRYLIKIIADAGDILNNNEFFGDVAGTLKEGIEQHKKREEIKSAIDKGNANLLGPKWTHGRLDKASDEIINKTYAEYKERELIEKGEQTAKALGKYAINLYSRGLSRFVLNQGC